MTKPSLYQPEILQHCQHPHFAEKITNPTHSAEGYNQSCGDFIKIDVETKGSVISHIAAHCECCAICKASASMMSAAIKDQKIETFLNLKNDFIDLLLDLPDAKDLDALNVFTIIRDYPERKNCATLPWSTLKAALEGQKEASTDND